MRRKNDPLLRVENTRLRSENAALHDQLARARAEIRAEQVRIDDLLDMTSVFALAPQAERLGIPHEFVWQCIPHQDSRALSVEQARSVMQQHLSCLTSGCRIRQTAVRVLRDGGHLLPDSGRHALIDIG